MFVAHHRLSVPICSTIVYDTKRGQSPHMCLYSFREANKIMSCAVGLTMVIFASRCPCVPPLFMTPKGGIPPFCVYIHFVMQIRSCHARSGLLLVIFAAHCPFAPPLFMTPKMVIDHVCVYKSSVMQISHDHSMIHQFMVSIVQVNVFIDLDHTLMTKQ